MNVQDYISSGIIESCVLGFATEQEKAEFEKYCIEYNELVAARTSFEMALERECLEYAVAPAAAIKAKLMAAIRQEAAPSSSKVVTMDTAKRAGGWLRFVAAAAVLLLIGAAFFAYSYYEKNQRLEAKIRSTDSLMNQVALEHQLMNDPKMTVVSMVPTEKAEASSANIYWDSTSSNVYMVIKNMPKLPSDKQYQLWAMIDGQPKDLGLFDIGQEGKVILKMNNIQKADAFAITIEKRGNTGGPTLKDLQTMGKTRL